MMPFAAPMGAGHFTLETVGDTSAPLVPEFLGRQAAKS